ncbi:AEC family transporter [Gilvimarinus sp. DA14]|uniref:AEC family transporter n=1 Tax=Gilvimarinus sp. DA14 TaxID=2956798 RepID=UPI0020B66A05|nr:AEC family transporter [Gilvimarinus sp. DA14]UTF60859.1 AEC family transporter [Gilvimarinus sp. DA14]
MNPFVLIALCLAIGLVLQFSRVAGESVAARLNAYVINIALPALILYELPRLTFDSTVLLPVLVCWSVMVVTVLGVLLAARLFSLSRAVTGCLLLMLPLGNTGFVGIPLIEALVGAEGIGYAILYDQFGTFLALNTFGIAIAVGFSGGHTSVWFIAKRILSFPPFISLLLAFALLWWEYPLWLEEGFKFIAWTLVPVVMVAVGISWHLKLSRDDVAVFVAALLTFCVLKPAVALGFSTLYGGSGLAHQVVVLEAGMPAMISAGVLAMRYNLAPRLAASLVGYSLPAAIVSLFFWRFAL